MVWSQGTKNTVCHVDLQQNNEVVVSYRIPSVREFYESICVLER